MSTRHHLSLSVQYPDPGLKDILTRQKLRRWVGAALQMPAEITLRFVDAEEGLALNRDYRGKDYATNVLTFPYDDTDGFDLAGAEPVPSAEIPARTGNGEHTARADIVLCTDVLIREAEEQSKTLEEHAAHLVIHGALHAQGYDHLDDAEAEEMEALETEILAKLGYPDPYR